MLRKGLIILGVVVLAAIVAVTVAAAQHNAAKPAAKTTALRTPPPSVSPTPPPNYGTVEQQAVKLAQDKNYTQAEKVLTTFLTQKLTKATQYAATEQLAQIYGQAGNQAKALSTYQAAVKINGSASLQDNMGIEASAYLLFTQIVSKAGFNKATALSYGTAAVTAGNAAIAATTDSNLKAQLQGQLGFLNATITQINK